jgi:uncharacterized protein YwgA
MSLILDYGLDSPSRASLILALSIEDRNHKKEMRRIHIQKVILYYQHMRQNKEIDFSFFNLGGVSFEISDDLETLKDCGLVEEKNGRYVLTKEGENAAEELVKKHTEDNLKKLTFAKDQLNDLSSDELMYFMYKTLPETQKNSTEFIRLEKKKETLVRSLFLKGRISSKIASEWLGITEREFLSVLSK